MKFVILSNATIPGYGGIKGPILTPQEIPLKKEPTPIEIYDMYP